MALQGRLQHAVATLERRPAARASRRGARPRPRPARRRRCSARPGRGHSPRRRGPARGRLSWSRTSTSRRSRARGSLAIGPRCSRALVLRSISWAAASRSVGERLARLLADQPVELGGQLVHPRDVGLLAAEQVLRGREVVEARARRAAARYRAAPASAPPPSRTARAGAGRSRRRAAPPASASCGAARTRRP